MENTAERAQRRETEARDIIRSQMREELASDIQEDRKIINHEDKLQNGYDYEKQVWVKDGKYIRCGHPESMNCQCYGRLHENEQTS